MLSHLKSMPMFASAALGFALVTTAGGPSLAEDPRTFAQHGAVCSEYANTAVEQARRNFYSSCGNSGQAWGIDRPGHYRWCMSLTDAPYYWATAAETAKREAALKRCKAVGVVPGFLPPSRHKTSPPSPPPAVCPAGMYKGRDGQCYEKLN